MRQLKSAVFSLTLVCFLTLNAAPQMVHNQEGQKPQTSSQMVSEPLPPICPPGVVCQP